jgi:hypothetical protein
MALVTVEELALVLGTGDLYTAELEEVIQATDNIILPLLKLHRASVVKVKLKGNIATYTTQRAHKYVTGQSLIITKIGTPFNGTKTIASVPTPNSFTVAITNADIAEFNVIPLGNVLLYGQEDYYSEGFPEVKEAAIMVCVDMWNARQSAFGQAQGVDFQPGPYKMGRSVYNRVAGLLAAHRDPAGMIG